MRRKAGLAALLAQTSRGLSVKSPQAQGFWTPLDRQDRTKVAVYDLTGVTLSYEAAMQAQSRLLASRVANSTTDGLLLVEHAPVYTLGRGATEEYVRYDKSDPSAPPLIRTERGGDVTYHGPGQLVAYPVLHLPAYKKDSHWYLRALEEVVIRTCSSLGIPDAHRHDEHTGVWLRDHKIAAVGVALRKWVTYHGIALNVNPRLDDFNRIIPCGLSDVHVGSLSSLVDDFDLRPLDVIPTFLSAFSDVFLADLTDASSQSGGLLDDPE